MERDATPAAGGRHSLVTFRLDRQVYALPIEPIIQIVEMVTVTPLPQVNPVVEGVVMVHGALVPVINLRRQVGLPKVDWQLHTPLILVEVNGQRLALIVDEMIDVIELPDAQLARTADVLPKALGEAPLLHGMTRHQTDLVIVLDLARLFEALPAEWLPRPEPLAAFLDPAFPLGAEPCAGQVVEAGQEAGA